MDSRHPVLGLVNLLLVVESSIPVCSLDAHEDEYPEKVVKYPDLDFVVIISWFADS